MNQFIYKTLAPIVKLIVGKGIIGKPFRSGETKIYYEKQQHLNFSFKKIIDYEKELSDKLKPYLKPSCKVFDVGSNIGQYALTFAQIIGKKGEIFCYEPDFKNFSFLQFNVQINNLNNVSIRNAGLGAELGKTTFYRDALTGGRRGSIIKEYVGESHKGDEIEIEITTLKREFKKHGIPDFIKIDVEGFEFEVIKGMGKPPQKTVFFIEVRKETKDDIFNFFRKENFQCLVLENTDTTPVFSSKDIPDFANLLFVFQV